MFSLYYSGGAANASPALSLGGEKSSVAVNRRLFGPLTLAQFQTGVTLYRCVYVQTSEDAVILPWIASDTPSPNTTVALGWGAAAINATEAAIAVETDLPAGVHFTSPSTAEDAEEGGFFEAGQYRALWLRYVLTPTAPLPFEAFTLTLTTGSDDSPVLDLGLASNTQYLGIF